MVIYKYPLDITDRQKISIGNKLGKPLFVAEQYGQLTLWVQLEDVNNDFEYEIDVRVIGTGHEHSSQVENYVGSVIMSNCFVWHIFADCGVK